MNLVYSVHESFEYLVFKQIKYFRYCTKYITLTINMNNVFLNK